MSTDRQMEAARQTAARDAWSRMSNLDHFKSAFHRDNPLHVHNRRFGVGILVATAGLAYLIMLAEEKQRHKETDAKAAKARDAAAAHGQHPLLPRK